MLLCLSVSFALSEYIAPKAEQAAEVAKLNAQYGRNAMRERGGFWIRDDRLYMHIQALSDKDGGTLWGVRQYWLDENLKLQSSLEAEYATYDADQQKLGTAQWAANHVDAAKHSCGSVFATAVG